MLEFFFACAGNLKKSGVLGERTQSLLRHAQSYRHTCLWRQVTDIHGVQGLSAWWLSQNHLVGETSGRGDRPRAPASASVPVPFLPSSGVAGKSPAPSMSAGNGSPNPSSGLLLQRLRFNPHFCIQGCCVKFRKVIFPNRQLLGCRDLSDPMKLSGLRGAVFRAVSPRQGEEDIAFLDSPVPFNAGCCREEVLIPKTLSQALL